MLIILGSSYHKILNNSIIQHFPLEKKGPSGNVDLHLANGQLHNYVKIKMYSNTREKTYSILEPTLKINHRTLMFKRCAITHIILQKSLWIQCH